MNTSSAHDVFRLWPIDQDRSSLRLSTPVQQGSLHAGHVFFSRVSCGYGIRYCEFDWQIGSLKTLYLKTLYLPTDPRIGYTSVAELATRDHMPKEEKMTCPIGTTSFYSFLLPLPLPLPLPPLLWEPSVDSCYFSLLQIMDSWFPLVIHHMLLAFGVMVEGMEDGQISLSWHSLILSSFQTCTIHKVANTKWSINLCPLAATRSRPAFSSGQKSVI